MDEDGGMTRETMEKIIEYGHQVIAVYPTEGEDFAPFVYSVGRSVQDRPELLITGPLSPQVAGTLLNDLAAYDDEHPLTAGTDLPGGTILGGDLPCRIVAVDPEAAQMFQALSLFGDDVTALQMLWPDKDGRLPGDDGYGYPDDLQPTFPLA